MHLVLMVYLCSVLLPTNVIGVGTVPSNCQRLTTINYHYSSTYHLPDMDADKTDVGITFNFSVRARSDGHLRLSSTPDARESAVTIEVILGAGANTFSAVRRRPKKTATDYTVTMSNILSEEEMRPFLLVLKGETLAVYANYSSTPHLFYEDSSVPDMLYISFGAWNNVGVEWSFDCRGAAVPEPPITDPLVKLKRTYWANYDPFNPPVLDNSTLVINMKMAIIRVNLNAKTSHFTLRGKFDIEWVDQKLRWNPDDYGNITHLNFKHRVIWMPDFELLDVPKADTSILDGRTVRLYHSGAVQWKTLGEVETWCDVDVTNWPADKHVCDLHIGLRFHPDAVRVMLLETPLELETSGQEWDIDSITSLTVMETGAASPQSFKLRITLKRIATASFVLLFVIPLFASFIMLVMSFIIAPRYKSRLALVSASIVTLHLLLFTEDHLLPALPQSTPRIMKTTSSLVIMAMLQLIFHSFNVHISNFDIPAPKFVKNIARKPWMKHLHQATYEVFISDEKQEAGPDQLDGNSNDHEPTEGINMEKYHWTLISRGLDVLAFTLSFVFLPFLLAPL